MPEKQKSHRQKKKVQTDPEIQPPSDSTGSENPSESSFLDSDADKTAEEMAHDRLKVDTKKKKKDSLESSSDDDFSSKRKDESPEFSES